MVYFSQRTAVLVVLLVPLASALGSTSYNGLAETPQMGWGMFCPSMSCPYANA